MNEDLQLSPLDGLRTQRWGLSLFDGARDRTPKGTAMSWDGLVAMLSVPWPHVIPLWRRRYYDRVRGWLQLRAAHLSEHPQASFEELVATVCEATGAAEGKVAYAFRLWGSSGLGRAEVLAAEKTRLPCWSPVTYAHGAARCKEAVQNVHALVLDFDSGCSIEEATAPWMDWPWLMHTSWSHTPEHPKFRLVLPLAQPVDAALWGRVYAWAIEHGGQMMDTVTKDASRLFFLPATKSQAHPFLFQVHDEPASYLHLEEADLPELPKAQVQHRPRPVAPVSYRKVDRERRRRLAADPETRLRVAHELGAQIAGSGDGRRASKIPCPSCGRPSLWFFIEPRKQTRAYCEHRKSCKQDFHLMELL